MMVISSRSGTVQQRVAAHQGRWRLGRAYDNDVIINDDFVCPHHLEVEISADTVTIRDLGSINGSWLGGERLASEWAVLKPGKPVQLGHSLLRYHRATDAVRPTRRDALVHGVLGGFNRPLVLMFGLLLAAFSVLAERYLEDSRALNVGLLLNYLINPGFGLLLWAGLWSVINRLTTQRANFRAHLAIASWALFANFLVDVAAPSLIFATGARSSGSGLSLLGAIVVIALVLHAHLTYVTHRKNLLQTGLVTLVAALLMGSPVMSDWLRRDEFSSLPRLDPLLRPPFLVWVQGEPTGQFLDRAEALKQRVDPPAN